MKKILQLIRPFCETRNIVALCLALFLSAGSAWAQTTVTDHMTAANLAATGTTYTDFTNVSLQSDAVYAGQSAKSTAGAIQLRSKNSNSGIITTASGGTITSITITVESGTNTIDVYGKNSAYTSAGDLYGSSSTQGTLLGSLTATGTITVTDSYEYIGIRSHNGAVYISSIDFEWAIVSTNTPSISAENVELDYDALSGEIEYALNNATTDGVLSASTNTEWITDVTVITDASTVTFNTSVNSTSTQRQGTITLTYTYGENQTVTKNVTVVQAGNPDVVNSISDITAAGTYTVQGTIVAKSQRGFIVGDGTGYVYYYNQSYTQSDYNIGDIVKLSGAVVVYGGVYEFNNTTTVTTAETSNYVAEEPAVLTGEDMDARVASTTPADLSRYVQYQGTLSISGTHYNITDIDGAVTAIGSISYPLDTDFASLDGSAVIVKGYYVGISTSTYYNTMLGSITEVVSTEPVINVANTTLDVDFGENNGTVAVTFENLSDDEIAAAAAYLCDANGVTATYDWIDVDILNGEVNYIIGANDGEARTAYFKVCSGDVCSDIVTVNQAAYVAPPQDYAELPFEFDGGKADIDITDGLTHDGLDSEYNSSPKLKFDDSGDWLVLHFNEAPGELSYSIKGNSFSGGTFTVQTSEDGDTYENLKTYTELGGSVLNERFRNIGENVRYIKWVYTNKSSGNVGLGNIKLALPSTEPLILVEQDLIEVGYEGGEGNISVTYENMGDEPQVDVAFFAEDGETPATYSWVSAEIDDNNGVFYLVEANEGEARTAYLKVYDVNNTTNTSNLITITQAAAPQQYTLTVSEFENLEIFTFVGNLNEMALESAGTIEVSEGDSVSLSVSASEGYILSSLMVDGQNVLSQLDESGLYTFAMPAHNVTVTATAIEFVPGEWVLTSLADLTENDVFVIVGTDEDEDATYALPNDGNSSAPVATPIVVVDGTLAGEPAVNLQWNLSGNATDGYTFYPNGDTENWLYCSTTANTGSNNNIKVGHGDNTRNVFVLDEDGYLITNDSNVTRYLSIYFNNGVAQDWRGYANNNSALPISFYKKVTAATDCEKIVLNEENGYRKSWDFDNYTTAAGPWTGITPTCWTVAEQYFHGSEIYTNGEDTLPQVYRPIHPENYVTSGNYSLRMKYRVLLAMPELDESVDMSRLRLNMNVSQTQTFYKLQVGVMDDPTDESTFVAVAVVNNPESDVMLPFECGFTNYTGTGRYIAFKNVGGSTVDPYSGNFLDDVVLSYADAVECNGITLPYTERFDSITTNTGNGLTGVAPDCWELVDAEVEMEPSNSPQLYYNPSYATSGNYTLRLKNRGVYAMPAFADSTVSVKDLELSFQLRQPSSIYRLQVGVVESDGTFTSVQEINNPGTEFAEVTVNFSSYAGNGKRIAFRNVLRNSAQYDYSYNFIDDIALDYSNVSCAIDNSYSENFDGYTQTTEALTGVAPDCWEVISEDVALTDVTRPQLYYNPDYAESGSYTLRLKNRCVYAMPEFAEGVNVGNLSMTFSLRQPSSIYRLQVGVVDAEGAFTMVEEIKNEGRGFEEHTVDFTGYEGVRIAFRNVLRNSAPYDYSYNFIDNINLAPSAKKSELVEGGVNDAMDADRYLNNIVVYPNPTTGNLYIDAMDVQKVECYNQMGQLVGVYDNANELNISDLSNGVYMLRITVPQGVTMRKVVKK